jgi:chromosome partitioning protein
MDLVTGNQLRAARALAGVEQKWLADRSGVSINTIRNMESCAAGAITGGTLTLRKVQAALEAVGIEFTYGGQPGVRLRHPESGSLESGVVTERELRAMPVVAIINYKGGVGKTSLTANLGAELAWRGKKVLLVDLDAQASLTFSFITPEDWIKNFADNLTIKSWFDSYEKGRPINLSSVVSTPKRSKSKLGGRGQLDLICSHLGLINVDLDLAVKLGGASLIQAKLNFISIHQRLSIGLKDTFFDSYDVILIDCPPNFNIVTKTAIIASDYILVPTRPDQLSTLGIDYLMRNVEKLIKDYNEYAQLDTGDKVDKIDPKAVGIVFTMIQEYGGGPIAAQRAFINQLKRNTQIPVFKNYIKRNDTIFADAPIYGIPVVLNGYNSESHNSVVDGLVGVADDFVAAVGL